MRWHHWVFFVVAGLIAADAIEGAQRKAAEALSVAQDTAAKLEELREECGEQ